GAQADARGLYGGGAHRHEELRVQELGVVEPRARVAELLGALDDLPGVGERGQEDIGVHVVLLGTPGSGRGAGVGRFWGATSRACQSVEPNASGRSWPSITVRRSPSGPHR